MSDNIVVVQGLPITCNPMKIKLRFEAECKVRIKDIKVESASATATIKFASAEDCEKFRQNLPSSIKFGDDEHTLKIVGQNESTKVDSNTSASTVSDIRNEKIPQRTDIIQTWSSLEELPTCESGIIVQPSSDSITFEDIRKYFEDNKESCGGSIATMLPMIDGIFIVFKDENVAEKVWNFRPHRIKGKAVAVFLKHVPPPHKYKLVVEIPEEHMSEEKLQNLLQHCSNIKASPKSVKQCPSGVYLVNYEQDVDEKDVRSVMEEFKKKNPSFKISFLLMSDCVKIKDVPVDISEYEIRTLFQNKERTGGGKVTRIDLMEDSSMLIYFASYKDAEAVFQSFAGKTLPVFGSAMKIRLYFHNLHPKRSNFEKNNPIDDYYAALFPGKDQHKEEKPSSSVGRSFLYNEVDPDLLQFFIKNSEHPQMLNSQLKGIATVKMTQKGIKINQKSNSIGKSSVMGTLQRFLKNFTLRKCKVPDDDVTRQNVDEMKASGESSSTKDLYLRWTNSQKQELVVAGLKVEVESFVKSLQPFPKDNNFLNLEEWQIRWLIETEVLDQIKKDYPAIGNQNKKGIELIGSENQTKAARHAIMVLLNKLYQLRFDSQGKDFVEFLLEAERNERIAANVAELLKEQKMCAILVVKNGSPYIIGPQECCTTALTIVNSALVIDESLEMTSTEPDKQRPTWKIIRTLESEGKIRITMKGSIVSIVGFHQHVTEAKEKLSHCDIRFRKIIKIGHGTIQHINTYSDFKTNCSKNLVSQEKIEDGVLLKGKMKEVEIVAKVLQTLQETIVKKTQLIEKYGIAEFLETKDGRDTLSKTGEKYRSTILFRPKPRQNIPLHSEGRDTPTMSQKVSLPEKSSAMIGPLKVSIRQGDITDETNDAIVNSIGHNFKLSHGMLSIAIWNKGGDCIQKELDRKFENDIRVTSSGKLKCKKIFHVVFPASSGEIIQCFVKMLWEADIRKCKSISIPAVHTGPGNLGTDSLARLMMRSFREFVKETKEIKHLNTVDIVMFEKAQMRDFKTELAAATTDISKRPVSTQPVSQQRSYSNATKHSANAKQQSLKIGSLMVSVRQGDITEEDNHAIVNSTGVAFDLSKGMVAQQILSKGGRIIQREVASVPGRDIRVTDAGNLKCIKIIHVVAPTKLDSFTDCLIAILKTAERQLCPSISVPAIGTGNIGFQVGQVAKIMLGAIHKYVQKTPEAKYLRKVDFVIFDWQQMKEFSDAIFENTPVGYDNLPQHRTGGATKKETSAPEADCVELWVLSIEKDNAEKALDTIKEKIDEALCSVILDDTINKVTEKEERLLRECGNKFCVRITRSDGQISIEGVKYNRFKAEQELRSILKDFALQPVHSHIWEYCDIMGSWHAFQNRDSQKLEEGYQKYRSGPQFSLLPLEIKSKNELVNFKSMKIGAGTDIRRVLLPVVSRDQNQTSMSMISEQSGASKGVRRRVSASSVSNRGSSANDSYGSTV